MNTVTTLGIDIAKHNFHLFATDERGRKVFSKAVKRENLLRVLANTSPALIGIEACGSAHYWAQKIQSLGHDVRLIHPKFVKPYVKSNKTDAKDAEAIAEAVTRPNMRFVVPRALHQQDIIAIHRAREKAIKQRTQSANHLRSLLYEYGIIAPMRISSLLQTASISIAPEATELTPIAKDVISTLLDELQALSAQVTHWDKKLQVIAREDEQCKRLMAVPGIGVICATAFVARFAQGYSFKRGRDAAAFIGLVPKEASTGGKQQLLGISKRGDRYLRKQLIHGARGIAHRTSALSPQQQKFVERLKKKGKASNVITVALANKTTRVCWAMLRDGTEYQPSSSLMG